MSTPRYPSLYQINTRVWLTELGRSLGRPATLDDIPDSELDRLAAMGFDWIWLLSVWQTGPRPQRVSRTNPEWRHEFEQTLRDLTDDDIPGSGFAITGYTVHTSLGGDSALARVRERMKSVACGSCSISSPITWGSGTLGSKIIPSISFLEASWISPAHRKTTPG